MLASLNHFIPAPFSYEASGAVARGRGRNLLPDNRGPFAAGDAWRKKHAPFYLLIDGDAEAAGGRRAGDALLP